MKLCCKFPLFLGIGLLLSCQTGPTRAARVPSSPFIKEKGWIVKDVSLKDIHKSANSEKLRLEVNVEKINPIDPKIGEQIQALSWVNSTYDDLALPMAGPECQIVQKQGDKFWLIKFYQEADRAVCLRYEAAKSFRGFKYIFTADEVVFKSAWSSRTEVLEILESLLQGRQDN